VVEFQRLALTAWTSTPQCAASTAAAFGRYWQAFSNHLDATADPRLTQALQRRVGAEFVSAHAEALLVVRETARLGLQRHVGRFVIDPLDPSRFLRSSARSTVDDLLPGWKTLGFMIGVLDRERKWPDGFGVCECCTLIHLRTRSHQKHCHRCRKRPAEAGVLGWGHQPVSKPGDRVTVRLDRWQGKPLAGLRLTQRHRSGV